MWFAIRGDGCLSPADYGFCVVWTFPLWSIDGRGWPLVAPESWQWEGAAPTNSLPRRPATTPLVQATTRPWGRLSTSRPANAATRLEQRYLDHHQLSKTVKTSALGPRYKNTSYFEELKGLFFSLCSLPISFLINCCMKPSYSAAVIRPCQQTFRQTNKKSPTR